MLDDILARLSALPAKDREDVTKAALHATAGMKWLPNTGPQSDAYFSRADVMLYGGEGGGGKTDLGLGLAFTAHQRSLIIRRKYANLSAITERAVEINGSRTGFNGSPPPLLRTDDGRYIQFGANQHLGDEQDWQGQPFDLKYLDEAVQLLEQQVRFHLGWLRSTVPGQRVRAVLGTNPPLDSDGDWIIGMFRPWLDLTHPRPAKHGELRWFVTAPDGADVEVAGPEPIQLPGAKEPALPMSRTFIPAKLRDNPYLIDTGYQAKLDGLPEPFRAAVRDGNFMAARADVEYQVIPTQWIIEAQARWTERPPAGLQMTAMGVDVAQGGADQTVLAHRYGGWYGLLKVVKGVDTPDGSSVASLVTSIRRDMCPVIVDVGGGYGGSAIERLSDNGVVAVRFNGAHSSTGVAHDGSGRMFLNKRAEAWWRFREALDPGQEGGSVVALPPDPELRSDLASATYKPDILKIQVEAKEDIKARLGRSPDKGDAAVMALSTGEQARKRMGRSGMGSRMPQVNRGYADIKARY